MRAGRRIRKVPVFLLAMMLTSVFHAGHSVWSFNIPHQAYIISLIPGICPNLIGLSAEQIKICFEKREQIVNVGTGAKMAIKECQFQFQYRRWNCSMPDKDKGAFLERITRQKINRSSFITDGRLVLRAELTKMKGHMMLCAMLVMTILSVTIPQSEANPSPSMCLWDCSEQTSFCQRFCRGGNCNVCASLNSACRSGCRKK